MARASRNMPRIALGCLATLSMFSTAGALAEDARDPAEHRVLFVDDAAVAESTHLTRRLHQPEKRGAVLTPDPALGEQWIQVRSAPWRVEREGRFALAYLSLRAEHCDTLLATSRDGVAWKRPRFTRPGVEPANKVIIANARPKFFDPANIVFDPDDADSARRFKALVGAEG